MEKDIKKDGVPLLPWGPSTQIPFKGDNGPKLTKGDNGPTIEINMGTIKNLLKSWLFLIAEERLQTTIQ